ncbi:transmembrane 220 family protein [Saccharophagus degradans]|uniref:Transmembrane 220 family protein n=1 Tax=Saccharophagus degradans TaxID=86304 RepID=A0AAW7XBN4_9GAMM|nr:transmembrane 220 family protein [Saccharophagus degradans]MBU2984090.1 transmembrane 220 family protein [Saccharophagus degradans]MDO6424252.1 transmembrane 220 family protein [Saccharophagus degradans]MDO6608299.1 transmembrane 220 family protein [Saccharophagus degradans]WGO96827.1 transmembrane 220 family protein [Saccharophagus degradans]
MSRDIRVVTTTLVVKIVHVCLAALLVYCAVIQLNDPDPYFWALMYAVCAAVPLMNLFARNYLAVCWLAMLLCSVGIGVSSGGMIEYLQNAGEEPLMQPMSDEKYYIEEAREMLGALVSLLIVLGYFVIKRSRRTATQN